MATGFSVVSHTIVKILHGLALHSLSAHVMSLDFLLCGASYGGSRTVGMMVLLTPDGISLDLGWMFTF